MAVDTANKRYGMIGLALPFVRVFPVPDGDLNSTGDRSQFLMRYPGITPSGAPVVIADFSVRRRRLLLG